MSKLQESRSWLRFNESIKSKYTKMNYRSHLKAFMKYMQVFDSDKLSKIEPADLQYGIEDYVVFLKQTTNPNSLPTKLLGIKHFCVMNQIHLDWDIIHKMYPSKIKMTELRCWHKDEIKQIASAASNKRDTALVLFLVSTGARIGVFDHSLLVRHAKKMPNGCMAVLCYAGTIDEYWSFLTPQATSTLQSYISERRKCGEIITDDSPLFRNLFSGNTVVTVRPLRWSGARSVISRTVARSGVCRTKNNLRYEVQTDHGFRKFFNTTLKLDNNVNYNIAEKLMGHKNGLDGTYLTPTVEQCYQEFKKIMHKLEIQLVA